MLSQKRQEKARKMEEEKVYGQLRDAMEALVHICRDGCRTIGPHDKAFDERQLGPCKFPACRGLESLVRHFASCRIKVPGGCVPCKRMWQLLELHSRMCQEAASCKVPLCRYKKFHILLNLSSEVSYSQLAALFFYERIDIRIAHGYQFQEKFGKDKCHVGFANLK